MHVEVVSVEHPQVTRESLDPNLGAAFSDHQVE
jgi:hypothetical protein